MIDDNHLNTYVQVAYSLLTKNTDSEKSSHQFWSQYCTQLKQIIHSSQIATTNLIISWYYLYKYANNGINQIDSEESLSLVYHLILISQVLANKTFDDQCYSGKTWCNIINSCDETTNYDTKLMNQLESHFLSVVDYKLSFTNIDDDGFWTSVQGIFGENNMSGHVLQTLKHNVIPVSSEAFSIPVTPVLYDYFTSPTSSSLKSPLTPLTPFALDRKRICVSKDNHIPSINLDYLADFQFNFTMQQ